jgi:hypothetical protein
MMNEARVCRIIGTILLGSLTPLAAQAWCFGPRGCVTDESVCDMGRNTTRLLDSQTFIWSENPRKNEIYTRLSINQVLEHCKEGQQLVLHSDGELSRDDSVLSNVAKTFCRVSSITRSPVHAVDPMTGKALVGFESKCIISKMEEARASYLEKERQTSTATLVEEGNRNPAANAPERVLDTSNRKAANRPECNRIGIGALLGLPGRCAE